MLFRPLTASPMRRSEGSPLASSAVIGALPAGPGYFGNFQVAVLAALEIYIPSASSSQGAAVFIFLLYVLQTGLTILFSIGGALGLRGRNLPAG